MNVQSLNPWRWIALRVVFAIHDRQIAEHGGTPGVRDVGAIESAMARPINLATYGDPGAAELAATYAFGLARNHGFADGNKRTAWVSARVFLADNGQNLDFDPFDAIRIMEEIAGGGMSESELADWFQSHLGVVG